MRVYTGNHKRISEFQLSFNFPVGKYVDTLKLPFLEFAKGEYPEDPFHDPYQLYIARKRNEIAYIGISENNIWNRWFSGAHGHILVNIYGEMCGRSTIGHKVCESPRLFSIELWKRSHCLMFCQDILPFHADKCFIKDLEPLMIRKFKPQYNKTLINFN